MACNMVFRNIVVEEFNKKFLASIGTSPTEEQRKTYKSFHEQVSSGELDFLQPTPLEASEFVYSVIKAAVRSFFFVCCFGFVI